LLIPEANRAFVANRVGCDPATPIGLDDGASCEIAGWRFTGIAAAHDELDRDAAGRHLYLGYIAQRESWTFYHSGDTLWYPGLVKKLRAFSIDVAFLPINGSKPERCVAGNLNGHEAAQLAHETGARWVVPCHYDMFEFNTADPRELFIPECEWLGQSYRILRAGKGWTPT
jgi:L-ascorbate metabolism protein UlaG (beta-lactamase superfamily)